MRILAIGATGFIGPYVLRELARSGHEVVVVHRGHTAAPLPAGVRHLLLDRRAVSKLRGAVRRLVPDVVLDIIPYTEMDARELLRAIRGFAGRVVVLSSADVYRNYDGLRGRWHNQPDPVPLTEGSPLRETRHPYRGADVPFAYRDEYEKIEVEETVRQEADLPATVLRLAAVYGPGDRRHRVRPYLRRMDDGRPAILLSRHQASWRWTRCYVENVAAAIAAATTDGRAAGRTYNVGDTPTLTEREWIERIGEVAGWTGRVVAVEAEHLPPSLASTHDWRYDLWIDTGRLSVDLDYRTGVPLPDALDRTVRWERTQGGDAPPLDYAEEDAVLERVGRGQ